MFFLRQKPSLNIFTIVTKSFAFEMSMIAMLYIPEIFFWKDQKPIK